MGITFETAKEEDLERCVTIIFSSLKGQLSPVHRNKKVVKQKISEARSITLIAKKKEKILGLISGTVTIPTHINFFSVVEEESARLGIGGILIDKFTEALKNRSPKPSNVRITLSADSCPLISLYSLKGFMIKGFIRESILDKDVVILEKRI